MSGSHFPEGERRRLGDGRVAPTSGAREGGPRKPPAQSSALGAAGATSPATPTDADTTVKRPTPDLPQAQRLFLPIYLYFSELHLYQKKSASTLYKPRIPNV